MDGGEEGRPRGDTFFQRGGIGGGAQLVADDVLRVHAAQCHADGLRLGKAGVDIAGHIRPGGKAIALPGQ